LPNDWPGHCPRGQNEEPADRNPSPGPIWQTVGVSSLCPQPKAFRGDNASTQRTHFYQAVKIRIRIVDGSAICLRHRSV
jgi:hypothetical protein